MKRSCLLRSDCDTSGVFRIGDSCLGEHASSMDDRVDSRIDEVGVSG